MEIRPILSSLLRNKTGALLIAAQVALSLAIVANALYIIRDRLALAARPSGVAEESNLFRIGIAPLKDPDTPEGKLAMQQRNAGVLRALPGVASVAWTNQTPLSQSRLEHGHRAQARARTSRLPTSCDVFRSRLDGEDLRPEADRRPRLHDTDDHGRSTRTRPRPWAGPAIMSQALAKKLYPDRQHRRQDAVHRHRCRRPADRGGRRGRAPADALGQRRRARRTVHHPRVAAGAGLFDVRRAHRARAARPRHEGSRSRRRQDSRGRWWSRTRRWTPIASISTATTAPSPGC